MIPPCSSTILDEETLVVQARQKDFAGLVKEKRKAHEEKKDQDALKAAGFIH